MTQLNYTSRLDSALKKAAWAHEQQGQHRKGTDIPYIIHPVGAMIVASSATTDEDVLIACLMHDILEDVDSSIYSAADMERDFGSRVVEIVRGVTKNDSITDWRAQSEAYLRHLEAEASSESVIVSLADKIHNLMSILSDYEQIGDEIWQRFTTKSMADQLWWYESILAVGMRREAPSELLSALESLLKEMEAAIKEQAGDEAK